MEFKPHNYQKIAVDMIIDQRASGLFLEMGLGKTVSTLTAIDELMYDRFSVARVLVIAPLRVADATWAAEVNKWNHLRHLTVTKVLGSAAERMRALHQDTDIYVINRENIQWLLEQYGKYKDVARKTGFTFTKPWPFDMVVIDELSSFKSSKSIRFKMLKKTLPHVDRIVGLTGTPAPNGLLDLWPQVYLLDEGERLGKTMTEYRDRYFQSSGYIKNQGRLIATDYYPKNGAEDKIYDKLSDICVSMKADDWLQMPERIDNFVDVKLTPDLRDKYKELKREFILELQDKVIDAVTAAALIGKLQQFNQGAIYTEDSWTKIHDLKLEALDELIEEANGKPVLIFYWFKHDRERLLERYKQAKELNSEKDIIAWNQGKTKIQLAHPASAGHGLNLQAGGNIIIWFGLTWSLELYQQANARLHRQGQTQSVIIHHLIMQDTVDNDIMAALNSKADGQNELMEALKAQVQELKEQLIKQTIIERLSR